MTLSDAQRAYLVEFAVRQGGPGASVEMLRAICYVIRNRCRKGWHDGNWIRVMEAHGDVEAHEDTHRNLAKLDPDSRMFQSLLRQVDDIYFGQNLGDWAETADAQDGMSLEDSLTEKGHEKLYWFFVNRPVTAWFQQNILDDKENHRKHTQLGLMMFVE